MEKTRKQELINQEALRLSGVFNTPIPALPPERDKALDKVKEPPHPSSCDGVRGGAGADPGAHGRGGHPQYGSLYAENGPQWLCAPC